MPYTCNICDKSLKNYVNLRSHQLVHSNDRPFKCEVCDKAFKSSNDLRKHKQIHSSEKSLKCKVCDEAFKTSSALNYHKIVHSSEMPKCNICDKVLKSLPSLRSHKLVHSSDRPFKCEVCGKSFKSLDCLRQHIKLCHSNEEPSKCDICGKIFKSILAFNFHKRYHSSEKLFKCKVCGYSSKHAGNVRKHELNHSSDRGFKCGVCDKAFKTTRKVREHERTHSADKPFKCSICDMAYTFKKPFERHIKVHEHEVNKCQICKKIFANRKYLLQHQALKHILDSDSMQTQGSIGYERKIDSSIISATSTSREGCLESNTVSYLDKTLESEQDLLNRNDIKNEIEIREDFDIFLKQKEENNRADDEDIKQTNYEISNQYSDEIKFQAEEDSVFKFHNIANIHENETNDETEIRDNFDIVTKEEVKNKPFKCNICNKTYTQKRFLQSHVNAHDQDKAWKCQICKKTFAKRNYLFQHKVLKHILNSDSMQTQGLIDFETKIDSSIISVASKNREGCLESNTVSSSFLDKTLESEQDPVNRNDIKKEMDIREGFVDFLKQEVENNRSDVEDINQTIKNEIMNEHCGEVKIKAEEDSVFECDSIANFQVNEINNEIEVQDNFDIVIKKEEEQSN